MTVRSSSAKGHGNVGAVRESSLSVTVIFWPRIPLQA
jgi:hypothetical protein